MRPFGDLGLHFLLGLKGEEGLRSSLLDRADLTDWVWERCFSRSCPGPKDKTCCSLGIFFSFSFFLYNGGSSSDCTWQKWLTSKACFSLLYRHPQTSIMWLKRRVCDRFFFSAKIYKQYCLKGNTIFFYCIVITVEQILFLNVRFWRLLYCKMFCDMVLFHTGITDCT